MPEIIIESDAREHLNTVSFDEDAYVAYLRDDRKMTEADIDAISIIFTNKGLSPLAMAHAEPSFLNEGRHVIRISPTRLPRDQHKQGRLLRHETEHVIQGCTWQYKAWTLGQLSFIGGTSIGGGALFAHQIAEISEGLAEPVSVTLATLGALGGAAIGAVVGAQYGKQLSPLGFGAMIAERKYATRLPDGVLMVG